MHLCVVPRDIELNMTGFIPPGFLPSRARAGVSMCEAQPPRDPGNLRSESSRRRNAPQKPLRRRRRRRAEQDELDWARMESVPLVGARDEPETGEDYWVDLSSGQPADAGESPRRARKGVGKEMEMKLRREVVSPYTQNWILWVVVGVAVLAVAFKLSGGFDEIPIIPVPDL